MPQVGGLFHAGLSLVGGLCRCCTARLSYRPRRSISRRQAARLLLINRRARVLLLGGDSCLSILFSTSAARTPSISQILYENPGWDHADTRGDPFCPLAKPRLTVRCVPVDHMHPTVGRSRPRHLQASPIKLDRYRLLIDEQQSVAPP